MFSNLTCVIAEQFLSQCAVLSESLQEQLSAVTVFHLGPGLIDRLLCQKDKTLASKIENHLNTVESKLMVFRNYLSLEPNLG